MPLLWTALRLILGIDISIDDTSGWTRMIWRSLPRTIQQFHGAEFLQNDTPPILGRARESQTALALSAILIAEDTNLACPIPS